jgi:uncharacterized membrane protein YbhN (UPF0104 family)
LQPSEPSERAAAAPCPRSGVARPQDNLGEVRRDERRALRRLAGVLIAAVAMVSVVVEVPALHDVAATITHIKPAWVAAALALELASCVSFVVIFRLFFDTLPAAVARELAWTEMGSGALLPGGGVGAFAVGGWLLHRAGMSAQRILESSSGLFFLTSGVNIAAIIAAGTLLALGIGNAPHDFPHAILPILGAAGVTTFVLVLPKIGHFAGQGWRRDVLRGVNEAERALVRPHWRLLGAIGYLAFDIAVFGTTVAATGANVPVDALVLAYMLGYLANLIPVPGGMGVLEGGLAGMLVLYGAAAGHAVAAVLVYHAIAFWIPSLGGVVGYARIRCRLKDAGAVPSPSQQMPSLPQPTAMTFSSSCGWGRRLIRWAQGTTAAH